MLNMAIRARALGAHMSFIRPSLVFEPRCSSLAAVHWGSMMGILMRDSEPLIVFLSWPSATRHRGRSFRRGCVAAGFP